MGRLLQYVLTFALFLIKAHEECGAEEVSTTTQNSFVIDSEGQESKNGTEGASNQTNPIDNSELVTAEGFTGNLEENPEAVSDAENFTMQTEGTDNSDSFANSASTDWLPVGLDLDPCAQNGTCNISAWERCVLIRGREARCDCIAGHARARDGTCVAVVLYWGRLLTANDFSPELLDQTSTEYRWLEYQVREALFQAVTASLLRSIVVGVRVRDFVSSYSHNLVIHFELTLSRSYAPDASTAAEDFRNGLEAILDLDESSGETVLDGTVIVMSQSQIDRLELKAPDVCEEPLLNYCDMNAVCIPTQRSFSCRCQDGYLDESPVPLEAPGEICTLHCNCVNAGTCELNENGEPGCRCPSWFLGKHCEIDGKVLLICVATILGLLLLVAIGCCASCMYRLRREHSMSDVDGSSGVESVSRYDGKKGNSWLDTWRYYRFSPAPYHPAAYGNTAAYPSNAVPYPSNTAIYPSPAAYASLAGQPVYRLHPRQHPRTAHDIILHQKIPAELYPYLAIPRPQVDPQTMPVARYQRPTNWKWSSAPPHL